VIGMWSPPPREDSSRGSGRSEGGRICSGPPEARLPRGQEPLYFIKLDMHYSNHSPSSFPGPTLRSIVKKKGWLSRKYC
jgi:hypothetical protein